MKMTVHGEILYLSSKCSTDRTGTWKNISVTSVTPISVTGYSQKSAALLK